MLKGWAWVRNVKRTITYGVNTQVTKRWNCITCKEINGWLDSYRLTIVVNQAINLRKLVITTLNKLE